jgi:hypothetical protein
VSDLAVPEETQALELKDVRIPTELFNTNIYPLGTMLVNNEVHGLDKTLSSRYARAMVLRSMLSELSSSSPDSSKGVQSSDSVDSMNGEFKHESSIKKETKSSGGDSTNLEQLSKLLKLVAANEGVLEGHSSDLMDSLVRAIQRTIDMNEKNNSGNNDLANLIVKDCVDHIHGAVIPSDDEIEVRESLHPCFPGSSYWGEPIIFPNARAIRISFQRNLCDIGNDIKTKTTKLTFYDSTGTKILKEFTPKSSNVSTNKVFTSFTTTESHVRYRFCLANNAPHTLHGFKFTARPLRGLGIWINEHQVLKQHSLEWACWLVDLMLNSKSKVLNHRVRDPNIVDALQKYIQKKSSPYKSRVVILLARLLSDVTMHERHQYHTNADDGMGAPIHQYMAAPDLSLMTDLCQKIFQKASTFNDLDVPS